MTTTTRAPNLSEHLSAVQRFYAQQMHLLDARDLERYAQTYTEDGEFSHPPHRVGVRTREAIVRDQIEAYRPFEGGRIQRRHTIGMTDVVEADGDRLVCVSYCLVAQLYGDEPLKFFSSVVRDVLVRRGGQLLVQSRVVEAD